MAEVLSAAEEEIDLFEAGLLIAWLDNPELDVDAYLEDFDRLGEDAAANLKPGDKSKQSAFKRVEKLRDFLFAENGFHGSRSQYYHHSNSYLNEVLDDREGLPITLAVVFLELAQRAQVDGLSGLALPGHFMVAWRPEPSKDPNPKNKEGEEKDEIADNDKSTKDEVKFIDVFDGGRFLTRKETEVLIRELTGAGIRPEHLDPPSKQDIVLRMIRNLVGLEMDAGRPEVARPYIDLILSISPEEASERFSRALLRYQAGETDGAKTDLEWLLENRPPGVRIDRLQELYDRL
jgi:regulator of sirC expression with transglutaminase-like and TPR domain